MAKETKIGLVVIGLLLLVFSGLLVRRLQTPGMPASTPEQAATPQSPSLASDGNVERASVVVAQKNSPDHAPVGLTRATWSDNTGRGAQPNDDASLHRGFMPADDAPADAPQDRYGNVPASESPDQPALETPPADTQTTGDDTLPPAGDLTSPPDGTDTQPLESESSDASPADGDTSMTIQPLEVPAAPSAADRNPLRRTSAVEPEETPAAQAATAFGDEPSAADADPIDRAPAEEPPADDAGSQLETTTNDPNVSPVADERQAPLAEEPLADTAPAQNEWRGGSAPAEPLPAESHPLPPADGKYVVQPNDNLWLVSEKVYGTGGYFKALYEFNRARLPRADRLVVGSVLAVPPVTTLEQNFPSLCPKQRKSAVVKARTLPASTRGRRSGDGVYIVAQGDTLFDIARYELGKASRWAEIYELNRDVLGEDFDYLRPGLELTMPAKPRPADSFTRQDDSRVQR